MVNFFTSGQYILTICSKFKAKPSFGNDFPKKNAKIGRQHLLDVPWAFFYSSRSPALL